MIEPLMLLLAPLPAAQPVTFADVDGKSTAQLARLLLPEDKRGAVVASEMRRAHLPGIQYDVVMWTAAERFSHGFCRRTQYRSTIGNASVPWSETTPRDLAMEVKQVFEQDQYALDRSDGSCAEISGWVTPITNRPATLAAVHQAAWAVHQANLGERDLPFTIDCREDDNARVKYCGDPRLALAAVPVGKLYRVDFDTGLREPYPGLGAGIVRQVAATRDRPAVPTARFGSDDGMGWSVELRRDPSGQVRHVSVGRTYVISH